ncbi:uncharacterized, partial [Tachysurus ichikawai]
MISGNNGKIGGTDLDRKDIVTSQRFRFPAIRQQAEEKSYRDCRADRHDAESF